MGNIGEQAPYFKVKHEQARRPFLPGQPPRTPLGARMVDEVAVAVEHIRVARNDLDPAARAR